jgi:PAS domain-containing protein
MTFLYDEGGILRQVLAMIEDITEKRRIRLDLEEKEAFQKAILSTLPDLKFRISKDGYYLDYYPAPDDNRFDGPGVAG